MIQGKLDNELDLALQTPETLRARSSNLNVGYFPETNAWELIVRYHGDLSRIRDELNAQVIELTSGYAIITLAEDAIPALSDAPEIEFIEKPKRVSFAVSEGIPASCIRYSSISRPPQGLYGNGVIIAVIDSGIDFTHPDFRNEDGSTRLLALWDQTIPPTNGFGPPKGYEYGTLYTKEDLDTALSLPTPEEARQRIPSFDRSGHGTHVAGIAAGNGRASGGIYTGVAPESSLLIVKLGESLGNSFPRTTNLMTALNFCLEAALALSMPIAINLSFGNNYGSHSGRSLLESFINTVAGQWKNVICIGSGNEGSAGIHTSGILTEETSLEFAVSPFETSLNLQLWKRYTDQFNVVLVSPNGSSAGTRNASPGSNEFLLEGSRILFFYGEPLPYNGLQEIYIEWIPLGENSYITSGIWKLLLIPERIVEGNYDLWLPGTRSSETTRFLRPIETTTLTIPSTAARAITVGAYNSATDSYAYFSGRGFTLYDQWVKPDLVAPGVNITSCAPGGGYVSRTGTSMSTPFVSGSAAIMMEWGILKGNDPYLYGEKLKAYLQRGARQLPGFREHPNPEAGYGALCLTDSLPADRQV